MNQKVHKYFIGITVILTMSLTSNLLAKRYSISDTTDFENLLEQYENRGTPVISIEDIFQISDLWNMRCYHHYPGVFEDEPSVEDISVKLYHVKIEEITVEGRIVGFHTIYSRCKGCQSYGFSFEDSLKLYQDGEKTYMISHDRHFRFIGFDYSEELCHFAPNTPGT